MNELEQIKKTLGMLNSSSAVLDHIMSMGKSRGENIVLWIGFGFFVWFSVQPIR